MNMLEDPNVPKQRCPRCFKAVPIEWFQPPVSICMLCYEAIPANKGLSLLSLKVKAKKSRWGRYYKTRGEVDQTIKRFQNSPAAEREQRDIDEQLNTELEECVRCQRKFEFKDVLNIYGNKIFPDAIAACFECSQVIRDEEEVQGITDHKWETNEGNAEKIQSKKAS